MSDSGQPRLPLKRLRQSFLPFVAAPSHNPGQQQEEHDHREDDGTSEVDSGDNRQQMIAAQR